MGGPAAASAVADRVRSPGTPAAARGHRPSVASASSADLIDRGRTWVKLSGAYLENPRRPSLSGRHAIAQAFVKAAPERMVWGSDWPHPTEPPDRKPNDAVLFDLLSEWAPDARRATGFWSRTRRSSLRVRQGPLQRHR